jgi:hypothetical protein
MIKATATRADGRKVMIIGLAFGNLDNLRAKPGDDYIHINGKEMGLPVDVMIFAGATEADCVETMKGGIGPDTKVHVSDRLKS